MMKKLWKRLKEDRQFRRIFLVKMARAVQMGAFELVPTVLAWMWYGWRLALIVFFVMWVCNVRNSNKGE